LNEQIKQLKQQAGIDYNPDQEGLDLFAKLIIEECAQRSEAYAYMSPNFIALAEELRTLNQG
jgi:hypothetical protein